MEINQIIHGDCMDIIKQMPDNSVDFTLTDIPYDAVNRESNGLRNLDKGKADILTFNIDEFLPEVLRVTKNSLCIFCGKEQFSTIFDYFAHQKGTTRQLTWDKSNPSPCNGQYVYLSSNENAVWFAKYLYEDSIENAIWFKKKGGKVFNAHCKGTVFRYPCGRSRLHPTEKNHGLITELTLDNTNEGDILFDPCCGSGSHCLVAKQNGRNYIGIEIEEQWYNIAANRVKGE